MQSGADLEAGADIVDLGGFLENKSLLDKETIWGMQDKVSIKHFQNRQTTNQVWRQMSYYL